MKTSWPIKKLEEVCDVVTDGVHKTPQYQTEGIRFISINNIEPFSPIRWNSYVRFISQKDHNEFSKKAKIDKGDILFPRIGTLGFAKIVDFDEAVSIFVGLGLVKPKKDLINSHYLEYWMNSPFVYNYSFEKANGSGRKTLALKDSRIMPVPLPPLSEQKRIVKILDEKLGKIKEAIKIREESIVNTEKILSRSLSEIFKEGKKKGWREFLISDIAEIKGGKRLSKGRKLSSEKTNHPYLRVTDFKNGVLNVGNIQYINEQTFEEIKRYTISSEDVFISIAGTIGLVCKIPKDFDGANLTENAAKITNIKKQIHKDFLYWQLQTSSIQDNFSAKKIQTTISKLALFKIAEQKILIPPPLEQKQIVQKLDLLSEKIKKLKELQNSQLSDLKLLKKSLLREAFNGDL